MNIDHLKTFVTLAETKSINKAAVLLHFTPPAIKHALDALEKDTGLTLFTRLHSGLGITPAGAMFLTYAIQILDLVNEGVSLAAELKPEETQTIDAPWMSVHIKETLYPEAFSAFQGAHPEISLKFRRVTSFIGEHFDVVNGYADVAHTHAVGHPLTQLPVYCLLAKNHPLADRETLTVTDLEPYRLLTPYQEMILNMGADTQSEIASRSGITEVLDSHTREDEFFGICSKDNTIILVVGEWPCGKDSPFVDAIPLKGATFQYCIYTQKNPTAAVKTYVDFMQKFYAEAGKQQ